MSMQFLQTTSSPLHADSVWKAQWTAQNEIVTASADGGVRVWDANPATLASEPKHHIQSHRLGVVSLSVSNSGSHALTSSVEGIVHLHDLSSGTSIGKKETYNEEIELAGGGEGNAEDGNGSKGSVLPAWQVALHPEGKSWASTGQGAKVAFYSIQGLGEGDDASVSLGKCDKLIETGRGKFGMDLKYSPDGRSLALSTETGHVTVIDVETQTVVATHNSHAMPARALSWSPDSQWLFSGSDDRRIVLHDVRAGSSSATGRGSAAVAELQGHTSWVLALGASPDNRLLVSGGADSTVKVWDVGQRSCVSNTNTGAKVWAVDFQPLVVDQTRVGKAFITGGDDQKITLWRAAGSA